MKKLIILTIRLKYRITVWFKTGPVCVINSFTDFANVTHIFFGPSDFDEHHLLPDLKTAPLFEIQ
jgi:hypothetical protein